MPGPLEIYFDYSCMRHVSVKITLYYIRGKTNKKEFLVMVLGIVFLLLSASAGLSVARTEQEEANCMYL